MSDDKNSGYIVRANIDNCFVSDWNPRKTINDASIEELAEGIRQTGVVQPPVARMTDDERIEIVAGQRRFLAAKAAGEEHIEVILREMTDAEAAIAACQENDQREDLPPLDEAAMYRRMMEAFGWEPEELGNRVGRSRAYIYRRLNLSECLVEEPLREAFNRGKIAVESARQLAGLSPRLQKEAVRILSLAPVEESYSSDNVSKVMRKLTPRASAEDFLARAAGELELLMDDATRDLCMDDEGNLRPESIYVDIEGKPDIAELKPNITPRKWSVLLEEAGCDSDTVPVYRAVDKRYGCHRLVERELAKDAIMANRITIFRSAPVSVDHAERLEAEWAENLRWKKQWALVSVIHEAMMREGDDELLDFTAVIGDLLLSRLPADLRSRIKGADPDAKLLSLTVYGACFCGCDDVTTDPTILKILEDHLELDPKAILRKVEAECEAKRPDPVTKKKRTRKAKEVEV